MVRSMQRRLAAGIVAGLTLVAAACSEAETTQSDSDSASATTTTLAGAPTSVANAASVVATWAGNDWLFGTVPAVAVSADTAKPPIKIGFISIDSGPVAATPELHQATDAAVEFINAELGGVKGRPVQIIACESDLGTDKAQACARKMVDEGVVAVLNGLNLSSGVITQILEENGIAWVGGIPLDVAEMSSPIAFQFSGGAAGAFVAFADHAANDLNAERVAVLYANTPQISVAAVEYGAALLDAFGVDVTEIAFDLTTQDFAAVMARAAQSSPDAMLVGAADFACPKVMQAISDLGLDTTVYLVGSCADRKWIDQVGPDAVDGMIFNIETRIDRTGDSNVDIGVYVSAIERYGKGVNAKGAATVAFRSIMNLYDVLLELGDDPTPAGVVETFRAARDRPSFDGHPYTCDGRQIPALPSLCASQEVLVQVSGPNADVFTEVSDGWVDVPAIVASELSGS